MKLRWTEAFYPPSQAKMIIYLKEKGAEMLWSTVAFGKYKGKTFPEIIVRDPDWFFWVLPKLYSKPAEEAQELARRARAIKTPRRGRRRLEVQYEFDMDRRFYGFEFVDADSPPSRWSIRLPYLDLWRPLSRKYDKRAGRIMLRDFRRLYFGKHKRLTKERCEEFFSDDANFIDI